MHVFQLRVAYSGQSTASNSAHVTAGMLLVPPVNQNALQISCASCGLSQAQDSSTRLRSLGNLKRSMSRKLRSSPCSKIGWHLDSARWGPGWHGGPEPKPTETSRLELRTLEMHMMHVLCFYASSRKRYTFSTRIDADPSESSRIYAHQNPEQQKPAWRLPASGFWQV